MAGVFRREIYSSISSRSNGNGHYIDPKSSEQFELVDRIDGGLFYDIFDCVHNYLRAGDQVDVHDRSFYEDADCYITTDGLSGFVITKSGDGVSGFNISDKKGFFRAVAQIFKDNCKTTDCYKTKLQDLPGYYKKTFGFKTASLMDFNYEILAEDRGKEYADYFVKTYGEAPVAFMVNTPFD